MIFFLQYQTRGFLSLFNLLADRSDCPSKGSWFLSQYPKGDAPSLTNGKVLPPRGHGGAGTRSPARRSAGLPCGVSSGVGAGLPQGRRGVAVRGPCRQGAAPWPGGFCACPRAEVWALPFRSRNPGLKGQVRGLCSWPVSQ